MQTTIIFAEILIIGIQTLLIALLLLAKGHPDHYAQLLALAKDNMSIIIPCALSLSYSAGVLVDRLADSLLEILFEDRLKKNNDPNPDHKKEKLKTMHALGTLGNFLEYQRSRIRIARSSFLNLCILFFVALYFVQEHKCLLCSSSLLLGLLTLYTWFQINVRYRQRVSYATSLVLGREN